MLVDFFMIPYKWEAYCTLNYNTTWRHRILLCCVAVSPAADRLRHILGEDDGTPTPTIFTEMDTLQHDGGELEWKESARYFESMHWLWMNSSLLFLWLFSSESWNGLRAKHLKTSLKNGEKDYWRIAWLHYWLQYCCNISHDIAAGWTFTVQSMF